MPDPTTAARIRGPAPPRQVVTLRVPMEVHTELRTYCVLTDTTVNDFVLGLIEDHFENGGRARLKEKIHGLVARTSEQEAVPMAEEG